MPCCGGFPSLVHAAQQIETCYIFGHKYHQFFHQSTLKGGIPTTAEVGNCSPGSTQQPAKALLRFTLTLVDLIHPQTASVSPRS